VLNRWALMRRYPALPGWAAVAGITGLTAFAVVGAMRATPTFAPSANVVPVGAMVLLGITSLAFAVVGALVAAREPRNAIGWLFLSIGGCLAVTLAAMQYAELLLPGSRWAEWATRWISIGPLLQMVFVLLFFPDGRLLSPRWRLAAWLGAVTVVAMLLGGLFTPYTGEAYQFANPVGIAWLGDTPQLNTEPGWYLLPVAMVVGAASFVARFRRTTGPRREQLKWFALAASVVAAGFLFLQVAWTLSEVSDTDFTGLAFVVLICCFTTIPVASGIAILRYRLYDIDIIINRTLVYGVLTAMLALFYWGLVLVLQQITLSVTPESDLAVAGSTLAVAALFRPARSRVQGFIDRRFYRRKYDAAKTLDEFSQRLRDEVILESLTRELLDVIDRTMEPRHISVWLRDTSRSEDALGGATAIRRG
jgi:hypothetical protein